MEHTAEFLAQLLNISRAEMDEIALRLHNNVERATHDGSFADEIVPVAVPRRKKDPIIGGGAGMVIMSADKVKELGLTPIAKIKATGMGACHPLRRRIHGLCNRDPVMLLRI